MNLNAFVSLVNAPNAADWAFIVLYYINLVAVILVTISFIPQGLFYLFFFLKRRHWKEATTQHQIAVIIAAHNEETVIANTVSTILTTQNYPKDKFRVYVIAHNCNDKTAELARAAGATVFELKDPDKSHACVAYPLKYGFQQILKTDPQAELFIRFDADNIPHPDYLKQMNNSFDAGAQIIRGYEAASNLKQNIWTEVCAIFYTKDSRVQNTFRQAVNTMAMTPGPGMSLSRKVVESMDGWDCMTQAEDAEFALKRLYDGYKITFNTDAIVYEDQPSSFGDTFNRLVRLGHSLNKLFFTDGWRMIVMFFRTGNVSYLDMLLQIGFNPISVICFVWFPLYYIAYAIVMLMQMAGVHVLSLAYFAQVAPDYIRPEFASGSFEQISFCGNYAMIQLGIMAAKVIAWMMLFCIFQSWICYFLDRKKLGMDWHLKGMWKGILLSPIFSFVYGICNCIGAVSHPTWKIAKRNPKMTHIDYPLPEKPKKIWYITLSPASQSRYDGRWWKKGSFSPRPSSPLTELWISLLAAFLVLTLFSMTVSFLYKGYLISNFLDSNFFQLTGKLILEGKVPYRDFFDHKGPFVFYIEALGYLISPKYGMYVLALINLTFIFFVFQRTTDCFSLGRFASMAGVFSLAMLIGWTYEGNTICEMTLSFVILPLYLYVRALKQGNDKDFLWANFINGLSLSFAVFTRATDCLVNAGFFLFFVVEMIRKKRPGFLFANAGLACLGAILLSIPPLAVSFAQGTLKLMFDASILANIHYVKGVVSPFRYYFMTCWIVLLPASLLLLRYLRKRGLDKEISLFLEITTAFFTCYFILVSNYAQYFLIAYPVIGLILALLAEDLQSRAFANPRLASRRKPILGGLTALACVINLITGLIPLVEYYTRPAEDRTFANYANYLKVKEALDKVPEDSRKNTFVFDSNPSFYLIGDFSCSCRYLSYQSWQSVFEPEIDTEIVRYVSSKEADYIVYDDYYSEIISAAAKTQREEVFKAVRTYYLKAYDNGYVSLYAKTPILQAKVA
jgi:cellulose synthase/poly-beta-1,6-N-acetylglucosamine synthase-like glycosyltransferase